MFVSLSRQLRHLRDELAEVIRDAEHVLPVDAEEAHADVVRRSHLVVYRGEHPATRSNGCHKCIICALDLDTNITNLEIIEWPEKSPTN